MLKMLQAQPADLSWELGKLYDGGKVIRPLIFEGPSDIGTTIPHGFTVIKITVSFEEEWGAYLSRAQYWIDEGYQILWDLDLGLFGGLSRPLDNEEQFDELTAQVERFAQELWYECSASSLGAILYSGSCDLAIDSQRFEQWLKDEELNSTPEHQSFHYKICCRDLCMSYVDLLSTKLPEACAAFVQIDVLGLVAAEQALLLAKKYFEHLHLITEGASVPFDGLARNSTELGAGFVGEIVPTWKAQNDVNVAILVPEEEQKTVSALERLSVLIQAVEEAQQPYRLISEGNLIEEWQNLDYLLVSSRHLSRLGLRSLQGFVAAGGIVVCDGDSLQLSEEIHLEKWKNLGNYTGRDHA